MFDDSAVLAVFCVRGGVGGPPLVSSEYLLVNIAALGSSSIRSSVPHGPVSGRACLGLSRGQEAGSSPLLTRRSFQ